jgi:hypothetical protein
MNFTYHLDQAELQDYVITAFGSSYLVSKVSKMHGGAQKVVDKVDCTNGFSCVLYVWDLSMNYFQVEIENADIHEQSYGADLFPQS